MANQDLITGTPPVPLTAARPYSPGIESPPPNADDGPVAPTNAPGRFIPRKVNGFGSTIAYRRGRPFARYGEQGDYIQYGENYYLINEDKTLGLETNKHGHILSYQRGVTRHHPKQYVSSGNGFHSNQTAFPTSATASRAAAAAIEKTGSATGYARPGAGPTGIKYSSFDSLTGGGMRTPSGTGAEVSSPGVYATRPGQLPAGVQVIVTQGRPGNAEQMIDQLQGREFTPGRLVDPRYVFPQENARYLAKNNQANFQDTRGNIYNITYAKVGLDGSRSGNSLSGEDRRSSGDAILYMGGLQSIQRSQFRELGFLTLPQAIDAYKRGDRFSMTTQERQARLDYLEKQGGFKAFAARETQLTGYPVADLIYGYKTARAKIVHNPHLISIENMLHQTAVSNKQLVNTAVDELPFNQYGKQEVRGIGKITLVYPSALLSGATKSTREYPESIPLAYGAGKLFGFGVEGTQFLASRTAAVTADSPLIFRTATAGISKGVQSAPYVVGGAFVAETGYEAYSKPTDVESAEYIGSLVPGTASFAYGDVSVRGRAQQALLRGYAMLTNAREIPATSIADPGVLRYYEQGPFAPGAMKFSEISPAGNLAANRAAFEKATFFRPTYNQRVELFPVGNAVDMSWVPRNPAIEVLTRKRTGQVKNYDVITATRSWFDSKTTVMRGTSKQGGLYVAPTGQAQLYFLGLTKESGYTFGLSGYAEPNLVRIRNIKEYSEDLIPILKENGQGRQTVSDQWLRDNAKSKTVYVESRTYFGETPEVQAVIPEGTPLKQMNLRTRAARFFGFRNYITVNGDIVPVRSYSALNKPSQTTIPTREIFEISRRSESYQEYRQTMDPLRSMMSSKSVRTPLYSEMSGNETIIVPVVTPDYSSPPSSDLDPVIDIVPSPVVSIETPSSMKKSLMPSNIGDSGILSGPSYDLLGSSTSSVSSGGSLPSDLSGFSGSTTPSITRGTSGLSSITMPGGRWEDIYGIPEFQQGRKNNRRTKHRRASRDVFSYTPSLLGIEYGVARSPRLREYSGIGVRGVLPSQRSLLKRFRGVLI